MGTDPAADGDRGDNTARCEVVHACPPGSSGFTPCCNRTPFELPRTDRMTVDAQLVTCAPAADRQTDEERSGWDTGPGTLAARLADWREEQAAAARPAHADAVMADLGAAITEGVTEARLREAVAGELTQHYEVRGASLPACGCGWSGATGWSGHIADAVLAVPEIRAALGGER